MSASWHHTVCYCCFIIQLCILKPEDYWAYADVDPRFRDQAETERGQLSPRQDTCSIIAGLREKLALGDFC